MKSGWKLTFHDEFNGPTLAVAIDKRFGDVLLSYREVARRLALGAAAENVVLRAHERGLRVKIVPGDGEQTVAEFRFFSSTAIITAEPLCWTIARLISNPPGSTAWSSVTLKISLLYFSTDETNFISCEWPPRID